jgi:hypothetical protein
VSRDGSFLYFACEGIASPLFGGYEAIPHGIAVVDLLPGAAPTDTSSVETEFYPFAGILANSFSVGDAAHDRVAVFLTQAGAQRLYVFDAARRAWTGSVVLGAANMWGGVADPTTGRLYAVQQYEGVKITEGASIPTIQGHDYPLGVAVGGGGDPYIDPVTHRLFVGGPSFDNGKTGSDYVQYRSELRVYRDTVPAYQVPAAEDPDATTHQTPEVPGLPVSYASGASGFGARVKLVGGTAGAVGFFDPNTFSLIPDASLRPQNGDREVYLGHVVNVQTQGSVGSPQTAASSVGGDWDDATESDLNSKTPNNPSNGQPIEQANPATVLRGNIGSLQESQCKDFGEQATPSSHDGSTAACDSSNSKASAAAEFPTPLGGGALSIGHVAASGTATRGAASGAVADATATAQNIAVVVPGGGSISIGEVASIAHTQAHGLNGTAKTTYSTTYDHVRIVGPDGSVTECGFSRTGGLETPSSAPCDPAVVVRTINSTFPGRVGAEGPRRQVDKLAQTPGGAQALVTKDPLAFWSNANTNHDFAHEVPGLQLTLYNDARDSSRLIVQLGAVLAESHYAVGAAPVVPPPDPASLKIVLTDGGADAKPLAGGVFKVYRDADGDGTVGLLDTLLPAGACLTGTDGTGTCAFEDLAPGHYVIQESAAPAGYATGPDYPLTIEAGTAYTATFTNLRAVGSVTVALTDDGDPAQPLPGGTIDLLLDDGDGKLGAADTAVASCTTDQTGGCAFADVPLAPLLVHQSATPSGYDPADDAAFTLSLPGQAAVVSFVNGKTPVPGSPPVPAIPPTKGTPAVPPHVVHHAGTPVVQLSTPPPAPAPRVSAKPVGGTSGPILQRLVQAPVTAAGFLLRRPAQAVLFAALWLVFGAPAYLLARRRTLLVTKEAV